MVRSSDIWDLLAERTGRVRGGPDYISRFLTKAEQTSIESELKKLPKFTSPVDWSAFDEIIDLYSARIDAGPVDLLTPRQTQKLWKEFFDSVCRVEKKLNALDRTLLRSPASVLNARENQTIWKLRALFAEIKVIEWVNDWNSMFAQSMNFRQSAKKAAFNDVVGLWAALGGKQSISTNLNDPDGPLMRFLSTFWGAAARAASEEPLSLQAIRERIPKRRKQKNAARARRRSTPMGA